MGLPALETNIGINYLQILQKMFHNFDLTIESNLKCDIITLRLCEFFVEDMLPAAPGGLVLWVFNLEA